MENILDNLNPAQKEAVTWPNDKPLLILAGAGSGKTRILTRRIAYLVQQGARPFNILGVTFTNKAAQEMKHRVMQMVRDDVWVNTFHATCLRILRTDGGRLGLERGFSMYDDSDQLVLIKESLKELNYDDKRVNPKAVRERISRAKDLLMTPEKYAQHASDMLDEAVGKVYKKYQEKMDRLKACDFGDLIMKTVILFDRHPDVLRAWQDRFQYILIDEYQDTNHAQYRLVNLLAKARKQITVVGDPDQSIYAWRGADIKNILSFEKDYPESGTIRMEQNYRSTSVILDAANELIKRNEVRKPKSLWSEHKGGEKISVFEAFDEKEEAMYVVSQVMRNVQEGKTMADQVVFYRMHAQSRVIEDMLRRAKIPYKIVGGTRFYDRKEIKDLIAYLKVVMYPHDDVSLKRIINTPSRGIGKKALETIELCAKEQECSFDQALRLSGSLDLTPKTKRAIAVFCDHMSKWRKEVKDLRIDELLEQILEKTGYVLELEAEKTVESQARIENIEEFYSAIQDFYENYTKEEDVPVLQTFLESISLNTNLDGWDSATNILTMMTMHTAKGLEFPIVYIVGLEEGIFPNVNSFTESSDDLEEERRLCYVGITRAKEKVHLIYARQRRLYGAMQQNLPSRFLTEIPSELYETGMSDISTEDDPASDDDLSMDVDIDELKRRIMFD